MAYIKHRLSLFVTCGVGGLKQWYNYQVSKTRVEVALQMLGSAGRLCVKAGGDLISTSRMAFIVKRFAQVPGSSWEGFKHLFFILYLHFLSWRC